MLGSIGSKNILNKLKMAKVLKSIHPLIQELNLSNKTKAYFNKLEFYEIIEDEIILSDKFNDLDEALKNRWSFGVDLRYCNADLG